MLPQLLRNSSLEISINIIYCGAEAFGVGTCLTPAFMVMHDCHCLYNSPGAHLNKCIIAAPKLDL
jgi:hypothetical protein